MKEHKIILLYLLILMTSVVNAKAENESQEDGLVSKFHLGVDLQTKYMWRGMEMMTIDAAPVVFPQVNYQSNGLYTYVMGGYSINGKYAEVDLGLSYTRKWLTLGVNGYYYPTTSSADDQYFDFNNKETGHWWEAVLTIAPENMPLTFTLSNFFAGADKRLDAKQAYSTYAEISSWYSFAEEHKLSFFVGAALNKSCYNGYEHGFGICNVEGRYTYNLAFKNGIVLPMSVGYIINPVYQKAHVNFTMNFAF